MKKTIVLFAAVLFSTLLVYGQGSKYGTYYDQRVSLFESLPTSPNDIILLGNSITNGGEWAELFGDLRMKNRGISGDITAGAYDRLDGILRGKPAKIFILIGVNDINNKIPTDVTLENMRKIIAKIQKEAPATKVYIQSLFPLNDCFNMFLGHTKFPEQADAINAGYKAIAAETGVTYIDLFTPFADKDRKLDTRYSNDGLHLTGEGYLKWVEILKPYIND